MTDNNDATVDQNEYGEADNDQLQPEDTLIDPGAADDAFDAGYDAPDAWSGGEGFGNTVDEQREGESLDQRLAQERPDVPAGGVVAEEVGEGTDTSVAEDAEEVVDRQLAEQDELDQVFDEREL